MSVRIELDGSIASFAPGQPIGGIIRWALARAPERANLRLSWVTRGRGDSDHGDAAVVSVADLPRLVAPGPDDGPYRGALPIEEHAPTLAASEARRFALIAPAQPVSVEGKLITVQWRLSVVIAPAVTGVPRYDALLVIAPDRVPIRLADLG